MQTYSFVEYVFILLRGMPAMISFPDCTLQTVRPDKTAHD